MKNYSIIFALIAIVFNGCSTIRYVPIENTENVKIEYRDSVKIVKDTVRIEVPQESQFRAVRDTLSTLETSVAISTAKVDSTGVLSHSLENKKVKLEKEIQYVNRVVYRDSVVVKEVQVPYEVEVVKKVVPKWCWWLLGFNLLVLLGVLVRLYLKFKLRV